MSPMFLAAYVLLLALAIYLPNAVFAVITEREWRRGLLERYGPVAVEDLPSMRRIFFTCGTCKRCARCKH